MSCLPRKNENPDALGDVVATSEATVRQGFIRKVYSILTLQFLLTVGLCAITAAVDPVREFIVSNRWLMFVSLIVSVGCLIGLFCLKTRYPINFALLVLFTLAYGGTVAIIVGFYFEAGAGKIVLEAAALTAAVFLTLTAVVFITKKDFNFLGAFLGAGLMILIVASIVNFGLGFVGVRNKWFTFAISCAGALIMSGYILYDTSNIIKRLGPDQAIEGAISLYLDVSNLFLYILNILSFVNN